jgi:hypothetical protein
MRAWRPVAWWIAAVFASGVALVIVDPHPASKTSAVGPAVTRATTGAPPSTAPADLASLLIDLSPDGYALAPDFPMDLDLEAVAAGRTTEGTDARRTELTDDGFGRGVTAVWSSGDQMSTAAIRVYEFGSDAGADRFFRFDKRNAASAVGSRHSRSRRCPARTATATTRTEVRRARIPCSR